VYRDPVYDGATDPTVIRDARGRWRMFYTQRRATHPSPGPGVAWVHGSRIGVALSTDGERWTYAGTLVPDDTGLRLCAGEPPLTVEETHWAPEVIHDGTRWRMYLTEIDGVPSRWDGHARRIAEYRSDDLESWRRHGVVPLPSDRVIDAAVARCPDGRWRLWYKDEAAGSTTAVAVSDDLAAWEPAGIAVGGRPHEGPFPFALAGTWWLLTDEWRGMAVYRSDDTVAWVRQGGPDAVILGESGSPDIGIQVGRHGSVVVSGDEARLYYFTHPWWDGSELTDAAEPASRRSAIHIARLRVIGGALVAER
jgi:hypothetical protein